MLDFGLVFWPPLFPLAPGKVLFFFFSSSSSSSLESRALTVHEVWVASYNRSIVALKKRFLLSYL